MYTLIDFFDPMINTTIVRVYVVDNSTPIFYGTISDAARVFDISFLDFSVVSCTNQRTHLDIYVEEVPEVFSDLTHTRVTFGQNDFYDAKLCVVDHRLGLELTNEATTCLYRLDELRVVGGTRYVLQLEVL
ncbi:MAG: hypothetical protein ACRCWQ_13470 [Bacilli bacterium]